ncbi:hypothetical protein DW958_19590 [Ruminococcus sp. AM46-18]|nr:hypothetical protein DW958_19590 [Ruminococcus sp. AM46-18]
MFQKHPSSNYKTYDLIIFIQYPRQGVRPQPVSYNTSFSKNTPRYSPILEEKPRRNKHIFDTNIKIFNL